LIWPGVNYATIFTGVKISTRKFRKEPTSWTGHPAKNNQDRTARTGLLGRDSEDRTARRGHQERKAKKKTGRTK
jgi:hypothetical protein